MDDSDQGNALPFENGKFFRQPQIAYKKIYIDQGVGLYYYEDLFLHQNFICFNSDYNVVELIKGCI